MSDIIAQRAAIVTAINADTSLQQLKVVCKEHGGRFNLKEVQKIAARAPAVFVACLGLAGATEDNGGRVDATLLWGVFIITADKKSLPRDVSALTILQAVLPIIPGNDWGLDDVSAPERLRADNMYSAQLDGIGVAMWAITWHQQITLGGLDEATLDDFLKAHIDWDMATPDGTVDAADDVDLPQ